MRTHYCPTFGCTVYEGTAEMEQCMCGDERVVLHVEPFTTHIAYRGEEIPIQDVLRALAALPHLRAVQRALDSLPTPKVTKKKRRPR